MWWCGDVVMWWCADAVMQPLISRANHYTWNFMLDLSFSPIELAATHPHSRLRLFRCKIRTKVLVGFQANKVTDRAASGDTRCYRKRESRSNQGRTAQLLEVLTRSNLDEVYDRDVCFNECFNSSFVYKVIHTYVGGVHQLPSFSGLKSEIWNLNAPFTLEKTKFSTSRLNLAFSENPIPDFLPDQTSPPQSWLPF